MASKTPPLWRLLEITDDNPEYHLYDSVITEFTKISGLPIYYYVKKESDSVDWTYGEDPNAEYSEPYETKLVYEPTEEQNVLDSFGITSDETIQYMQIPKSVFEEDIGEDYTEKIIPKVGDCVRTLWNNKVYEIVDVGSEQKVFQARKLIWEFITRPYRHSEESDSADDLLFDTPPTSAFPDINVTTETDELSAYGDNEDIEEESTVKSDVDTSIYGF